MSGAHFFQHRALRDVHNDITNEADVVDCLLLLFLVLGRRNEMGWEVLCEIGVCVGIILCDCCVIKTIAVFLDMEI